MRKRNSIAKCSSKPRTSRTQANLDKARANRDTARANVEQAHANTQTAEINLGYTTVTAPFDGVVTGAPGLHRRIGRRRSTEPAPPASFSSNRSGCGST